MQAQKSSRLQRREFLRRAGGAVGVSLAGTIFQKTARGQRDSGPPLAATKLNDALLLITGAGSNVVAANGSDGVLLVDGGSEPRSAELERFVAAQFANRPTRVLFNTHWHPEHSGSNETLGKAGAKIIAHENTKLWLGTEIDVWWQKRTYAPRSKEALPTETFYTSGKMTFGTRAVQYGYLMQAHTDGDIYVFFPDSNVLVAGDVVVPDRYPILDWSTGGWLGGMIQAHQTLLKIANDETQIVPGDGPVMTKTNLRVWSDNLVVIKDRLVKLIRQGKGPKEIIDAAPLKDFDEKWGNSDLFIANAYRGMWGHVGELGGIV
jgi:cyclase